MERIPHDWCRINAADPTALTRLLDLEEVSVTLLERAAWQQRLYLHCQPPATTAGGPQWQCVSAQIHQYQRRTVRDLAWSGWPCYLQIARRRFWCAPCQRPFTEAFTAVAPCARTTRRWAAALVRAGPPATIAAGARAVGHGYKAVEGLFYRAAAQAHPVRPPAVQVQRLGVDEIAARKGRRHFKRVLVDLDRGCVIAQLADRRKETLRAYLQSGSAEARAAVQAVATDFWAAYHEGAAELLPPARGVGDRFHVQQQLNAAVTTTRRVVPRTLGAADAAFVRQHRQLLLCNDEDLAAEGGINLTVLKSGVPLLDRVPTLKEELRTLFNQPRTRAAAVGPLQTWRASARTSGAAALVEFAAFVTRWQEPILNYFVARTTRGQVEGRNNKIKLVKRQALGFANDSHFRLRVLLACGDQAAHTISQ